MSDNVTPEQTKLYVKAVDEATKIGKVLKGRGFSADLIQEEMFKYLGKTVSKLKKAPDVLIGTTNFQKDRPPLPDQPPQEQE